MSTSRKAIAAHLKPKIDEGDGSKESPFVIVTASHTYSALLQADIINDMYGEGTYNRSGQRNHYYSPRGHLGNKDLCEHVVLVSGCKVSVWFDLYRITQLVNDPGMQKVITEMHERHVSADPGYKQAFDNMVDSARRLEESRAHPRKNDTNHSTNVSGQSGCVLLLTLTVGIVWACVHIIVQ